ncbi:hypothetical protein RSOLAG22IIIB_04053 [Rhizoctonia solani]|uniref:Uncharacterized protein n=1 Tax=Rhizoctonia solani TaxID=456999 RepID=A0A0K6FUE5_9AGAM|nr:hypothetical protein RSOLAG22IIIB_04053 [Rhizoctonia solani]
MTRRKRKNLNLAPGALTSGTHRGGNSPTTEPINDSTDATPRIGGLSLAPQSSTSPTGTSGPHRRAKGVQQTRRLKRGGNPYTWMPPNDPLSSPTTEEALPITPRSDMSSTFSVSPSPRPSFGRPQSPIYERRGAVSAGPHNTTYGFLPGAGFDGVASASAPLIPAHTWPTSTVEDYHRFPEPAIGELVQTRSEGALEPQNQVYLNQPAPSTGYNLSELGIPQITVPYDPNRVSEPTNYSTPNYQHVHYQPSTSRIDSSFLAEQAFPWQGFSQAYPSGTMTNHSVNPNDFSLELPGAATNITDTYYTAHNGPYYDLNGYAQVHFFGSPHTYDLPPMADLGTDARVQRFASDTRRPSLANLAFSHTHSTQ